jgi:hypothetical protein
MFAPEVLRRNEQRAAKRAALNVQKQWSANIRQGSSRALRRNGQRDRPIPLFGCSLSQFRRHLELQFLPGMSWDNYSIVWELDHIRALSTFNLLDLTERNRASHYLNVRPLWVKENRATKRQKLQGNV